MCFWVLAQLICNQTGGRKHRQHKGSHDDKGAFTPKVKRDFSLAKVQIFCRPSQQQKWCEWRGASDRVHANNSKCIYICIYNEIFLFLYFYFYICLVASLHSLCEHYPRICCAVLTAQITRDRKCLTLHWI